jgi:hypothetical protein
MTRHVDRVDLHWSKEEFSDRKDVYKTLSRERLKQNIVDFEKAEDDNRQLNQGQEKGRGGGGPGCERGEQLELDIEEEKAPESREQPGRVMQIYLQVEKEKELARNAGGRPARAVEAEISGDADKEAQALEKEWDARKPGTLKELAAELDGMSKDQDPSLAAIEKELGTIEKLDELDRVLEKGGQDQGQDLEKAPEEELEKDLEKDQEKDKGMQHELTRDRGGGRGFGFGF